MQNKLTIIKRVLPVVMLLYFSNCKQQQPTGIQATKEPEFKAFAVKKNNSDTAWGYIIEHNHRLMIKQFSIPALAGEQPFKDRQQAATVGDFVAGKLNRSLSPGISKTELDSLGIIKLQHADKTK